MAHIKKVSKLLERTRRLSKSSTKVQKLTNTGQPRKTPRTKRSTKLFNRGRMHRKYESEQEKKVKPQVDVKKEIVQQWLVAPRGAWAKSASRFANTRRRRVFLLQPHTLSPIPEVDEKEAREIFDDRGTFDADADDSDVPDDTTSLDSDGSSLDFVLDARQIVTIEENPQQRKLRISMDLRTLTDSALSQHQENQSVIGSDKGGFTGGKHGGYSEPIIEFLTASSKSQSQLLGLQPHINSTRALEQQGREAFNARPTTLRVRSRVEQTAPRGKTRRAVNILSPYNQTDDDKDEIIHFIRKEKTENTALCDRPTRTLQYPPVVIPGIIDSDASYEKDIPSIEYDTDQGIAMESSSLERQQSADKYLKTPRLNGEIWPRRDDTRPLTLSSRFNTPTMVPLSEDNLRLYSTTEVESNRMWSPRPKRALPTQINLSLPEEESVKVPKRGPKGCFLQSNPTRVASPSPRAAPQCKVTRSTSGQKKTQLKMDDIFPRRSSFSIHDKALKQAGFDLSDFDLKLQRASEKENWTKTCPLKSRSDSGKRERNRTLCGSHKAGANEADSVKVSVGTSSNKKTNPFSVLGSVLAAKFRLKAIGKKKTSAEKSEPPSEYMDKSIIVNHQRLVTYLKLVKEKPSEYKAMQNGDSITGKPVRELIHKGRAFQRGRIFGPPESIVVQAAYELGNKCKHPCRLKYEQIERVKSLPDASQEAERATETPTETQSTPGVVLGELTAMERARAEVDRWFDTLTMAQGIKARELALSEMGESSHSIRNWWNSQKFCHYLRQRCCTKDDCNMP